MYVIDNTFYSILLYSILFYSILFYSILFYSIVADVDIWILIVFDLLIIWLSTGPWINEQVECLHDVMQPLEMDTGLQAGTG